jgi:lysophospholipid acyltransferase (LPLAT)-like uncharacterized protein
MARVRKKGSRRSFVRRIRHAVRPLISRPLSWLAALLVPLLYVAYMRLVWVTSRVDPGNFPDLHRIAAEHGGAIGLLWHEEAMLGPFTYARLGFRPHTLAGLGDAGDVATRTVKMLGYVVFRGGSARRSSRRREHILRDMIEHMSARDDVIYGLTVDGSKGPAYRMKTGGIVIARECGKPIILARVWVKRCFRLNTWDRTAIPLPFNRISCYLRGPYFVPEDAHSEDGLEAFRDRLEDDLIDLAAHSYQEMRLPRPENLVKRKES